MNITLSNINWLAVFPLGIASIFFMGLGLRRGIRFFDHENSSSQKERLRDIFLSTFDIVATAFCVLIAMSPTKLWFVMIPIGLALFVFTIPISLLGSYYQLHFVTGYMLKNAGVQTHVMVPSEKSDEKIAWYEFAPFAFIIGWLIFFLVNIAVLATGWITGKPQELYGFGTIIGIIIGTIASVIVILGAYLKSKRANPA